MRAADGVDEHGAVDAAARERGLVAQRPRPECGAAAHAGRDALALAAAVGRAEGLVAQLARPALEACARGFARRADVARAVPVAALGAARLGAVVPAPPRLAAARGGCLARAVA